MTVTYKISVENCKDVNWRPTERTETPLPSSVAAFVSGGPTWSTPQGIVVTEMDDRTKAGLPDESDV